MYTFLKKKKNLKANCHSSLDGEPQATPTGGPERDERSEQSNQIPAFAGMTQKENKTGMTQSGRSITTCHPWTSVSEIRGSTWCGLNVPHFTRFAQSGRSMVEMLGVLAVIGVLSVAGITGYTTAMNQYRANEAINRAMRVAVMASSQRLLNPSAVLTDLEDGVAMGNDANNIVLTLSNIDDKVRSRIDAMGLKNATVTQGENGALTFTFKNDLSEVSGSTGGNSGQQQEPVATCPADFDTHNGCQSCENGVVSYATKGTSCANDDTSACDGNGTCTPCPSGSYALSYEDVDPNEEAGDTGCYCINSKSWSGTKCRHDG